MAYSEQAANYPGQGQASTAVKAVTVSSALEDFDPILGRLETIANRAMTCGDKISGSRPSPVDSPDKPPAPNHLIFAIQARRERLLRVVNYIEEEIHRIENGLA